MSQKLSKEEWKKKLTKIQYQVTQEDATEPPFQNEFWNHFEKGLYVDITTGAPLFLSKDKFPSSCGWPAFSKPIDKDVVTNREDNRYFMHRVEVRSKEGDAHLGHVFSDGPKELGGLRYCINSAALRFIPYERLEEEGYGEWKPLLSDQ